MNASTICTLIWTIKILGSISMIILSIVGILILGVISGRIEPNGSMIEELTKFLFTQPWIMVLMLVLAGWSTFLFWKKK